MIKAPFTVRIGQSGTWIQDAHGLSICDINPLLDSLEAFRVAELLASAANQYLRNADHARQIGHKGGRPKLKKPSAATLAKRKSRAKQKSP